MKKKTKLIIIIALIVLTIGALLSFVFSTNSKKNLLTEDGWEENVKDNIEELIKKYKRRNNYVVFDFDNTSSIFDIEEQLSIYQIETMSFEIKPEDLKEILLTDLSTEDPNISGYGYFSEDDKEMTYSDLADDIVSAYTSLWNGYGEFNASGLSEEDQLLIHNEDAYKEFSTKMRMMYDLVYTKESSNVAYPWILYWFTGMSEEEVYNLAYKSHEKYSQVETEIVTWSTPSSYQSKTGSVSFSWTKGISVTNNIKELYRAFSENKIDVWICSASSIEVVRAAVDFFGLHDYVSGILAMVNKLDENGKFINEYNYETGVGYKKNKNGEFEKMVLAEGSQTQGEGKVTAIKNTIYKLYDRGPIAGFMDSTGDFNFCTEFKSLKLVVCFNRANRKVTDGGGLIACLAMYQKETLGYDLKTANNAGDTLYLLQGRDENGMRTFRSSNKSILYGSTQEKLFRNSDCTELLNSFIANSLTTEEILNTYSIKSNGIDTIGFKYGFLSEYSGYHSI